MKAKKIKLAGMMLLHVAPGACPMCGVHPTHSADDPHDARSLLYQYQFFAKHGRWPTWKDALAHCPAPVRRRWIAELKKRDMWPGPKLKKSEGAADDSARSVSR